jgi:hypothetical protein
MCILYNQQDATYTMFLIIISTLHVSGGFSTHHRDLIKPLVWMGWNPSTPAVDSRKV